MVSEDPANGPENPEIGGEGGTGASAPPGETQDEAAEPGAQAAEAQPQGEQPEDADSEPQGEAERLASALQAPPLDEASAAYLRRAQLAEDRLGEVLGAYRKLRHENEGYRDRLTRNFERRFEQRRERLLLKFIEILDNLDRALEAAETSYAGEPLIQGLILVRTQLLQTLKDEGLEWVPVLGLPFDPATSEAMSTQPVDEPEHNHLVIKDLLRGYRLHGRLVRAARVVVGEHAGSGAQPGELEEAGLRAAAAQARVSPLVTEPEEGSPPEDDQPPPELHGDPDLDAIIARAEGRAAAAEGQKAEPGAADEERAPADEDRASTEPADQAAGTVDHSVAEEDRAPIEPI